MSLSTPNMQGAKSPAPTVFSNPSESRTRDLLAQSGLPTADLTPAHLDTFFACGGTDRLDGVVGLELHGSVALLRSLAVTPQRRGTGLGRALVAEAERYARARGVRELFLLTTTAEHFFEHLGYRRIAREGAPEAIRGTQEFASLCPSSSAFMVKPLSSPAHT